MSAPNRAAPDERPKTRCVRSRASLPLAACLASAAFSAAVAEPPAGRGEIRFEGDVVSVSALATPVDEILRSLGRLARFTVSERCGPGGCAVVSGRHRGPLSEIMSWVLNRQNHLILYSDVASIGASPGIARIVLLPSDGGVPTPDLREEIAPSKVASTATAEERRALRRLRAARLAPPSTPRNTGSQSRFSSGFAMLTDEQELAHSATQRIERLSAFRISSQFGWRRDPVDGEVRHHDGIDLMVPAGAALKSRLAGNVVFAGWAGHYGNMVEIDHGGEVHTRHAHLGEIMVEVGERVHPGSTIGIVGGTGKSTGPHLHFEVRVRGQPRDPLSLAGVWPDVGPPVTGLVQTGG